MIIKNMDNKKDIAFWIMVLAVVILIGYVASFVQTESYKCMSDPLVYGVNQYRTTEGDFTCSCSSPFADSILVTKDGISSLQNYNTFLLPKS